MQCSAPHLQCLHTDIVCSDYCCPNVQDAKKGVKFERFPPVLNLHLKRFDYDYKRDLLVKVRTLGLLLGLRPQIRVHGQGSQLAGIR